MVGKKRAFVETVLVPDPTPFCLSGGEVNLRDGDGARSEREGLGTGDLQVQ